MEPGRTTPSQTMGDDTAALVRRCRGGDALAWEDLVRRYQGRVLAVARHYVGDLDDARDLTQEIFLRIYRRLDSCRDPERLLAWILKLARHACIDHLRRRRSRQPWRRDDAVPLSSLAHGQPTPEDVSCRESSQRLVRRALQRLGRRHREVLILREIQGLPLEEVASLLGIPGGTVKSRAHRAKLELARAVIALGGGPGGDR